MSLRSMLVKGMDEAAKSAVVGQAVKKLTKAERERLARGEQLGSIIDRRNLQEGPNPMPFINPSKDELAAIRAEHGPSPIQDRNLYEGSASGDPPYVSTEEVKGLFPPAQPRTREQRYLERAPIPESGMSARAQAMINDPNVRARIKAAAEKGRSVQDWYDTTSLQKLFTDEFGQEEGMRRFSDFIGMVASTSTGSKIGQNIKNASNYFAQKYGGGRDVNIDPYIRRQDVEELTSPKGVPQEQRTYGPKYENVPRAWETPPEGYGHVKEPTHFFGVNEQGRMGGIEGIDNPKTQAFYENLMGNWLPTTLDLHATRLSSMATRDPRWLSEQGQRGFNQMQGPALDQNAVMNQLAMEPGNWEPAPAKTGGEYAAMEQMWDQIAKEMGVSPAELQAMAWVGGGEQTGLGSPGVTFMDAFMDRVRRTSIRDNIPPDQVIKLMLHGKMTLAELEPQNTGYGQGATAVG